MNTAQIKSILIDRNKMIIRKEASNLKLTCNMNLCEIMLLFNRGYLIGLNNLLYG